MKAMSSVVDIKKEFGEIVRSGKYGSGLEVDPEERPVICVDRRWHCGQMKGLTQ